MIWITIGDTFISDANSLCHESNGVLIHDEETCSLAVSHISNQRPHVESESDWPRGCYITNERIYFNGHLMGSRNVRAQPVCISKSGILDKLPRYVTLLLKGNMMA